jgi:membrane protease YdiL (CAAX protease family)
VSGLTGAVRRTLWDRVERDHRQSAADFRRRQRVTALTTVIGAGMLAWGLNAEPGSGWFYVATIGLVGVWTVGAFTSGPLHLGRIAAGTQRRPVVEPLVVGVALAALFIVGALVVREIDLLAEPVNGVLEYFREGAGPAVVTIALVNGLAEELFFRGALYASIPGRHQVAVTTVVYLLATSATGNVMLAFAAGLLGVVVGLQRRASGGVLGPMITHVTWSALLLITLPIVFDSAAGA